MRAYFARIGNFTVSYSRELGETAGRAAESVKQEVAASLAKEADPIDESSLPRDQREHSREYFEKLLKGE